MSSEDHKEWVTIALLGKPRGNRGELNAISFSSKPERFEAIERVYLSGHPEPFAVEEIWEHKGSLIFKFAGVESINDAGKFYGCEVRLPIAERAPLDPGEYYHSDLIGCEVIDLATNKPIGKVKDMQEGGGNGLLVIEGDILFPFTTKLCRTIDIANRRIEVDVPEGLLNLND